ncbi:hypothetical protein EVAR_64531_1 [Eumeta japonica]|uniref:Uncharacterized protein n=1 Tax=Eumeta variegata TaxID=151549 RepID=A0A4C1ZI06_EUMVA|nr:hypothetical protein EVAR_64531_1 [Eumeta japonica]
MRKAIRTNVLFATHVPDFNSLLCHIAIAPPMKHTLLQSFDQAGQLIFEPGLTTAVTNVITRRAGVLPEARNKWRNMTYKLMLQFARNQDRIQYLQVREQRT